MGRWFIWLLIVITPGAAMADQIVMITGETFSSPSIWEENETIRFNMHGLIVSVDKSEVAQIIRDPSVSPPASVPESPSSAVPEQPPQDRLHEPASRPNPAPEASPHPFKGVDAQGRNASKGASASPKASGIGLEGVIWQMQPSDLPGLIKLETDPLYGGIDQYYRENDTMRMGRAVLAGRAFGFWRNRLYTITMWVEGPAAYRHLRQAVFERYGRGHKNSNGQERYVWEDPTTDRMLEFDPELNTGLFWMRSRELDQAIRQLYSQ
jgi:hypothetical protein